MFAGANSSYEDSEFVIFGVPFDKTSSFRAGSAKGPQTIRDSSFCFEPYMLEHDVSLKDILIHDMGDIQEYEDVDEMGVELEDLVSEIVNDKKIPIVIGGEHSVSPFVLSGYKDHYDSVDVVVLDAHLDFREEYEGLRNSHAVAVRRISESEIVRDLKVLGVRSMSQEEAVTEKPTYVLASNFEESVDILQGDLPIYLSIDMDVFDPAYAPGVGNPEPFGVKPVIVKEIIQSISSNIIGMDLVETNPRFDVGDITSILASRLIYEFIGSKKCKK